MKGAGPLDWHTVDSLVLIGVTDPVEADVGGVKEGRSVGCIARTPRAVRGREANTTVALGHSARATRRERTIRCPRRAGKAVAGGGGPCAITDSTHLPYSK